jgi:glycosyltransferase involved in cell wall biosynthesis
MKKITEKDTFTNIHNYEIIPNVINTKLFKYTQKSEHHRKKILLIRSFNSNKYANDIAIDAILELSKKEFFSDLEFAIYGEGKYFEKLTAPLKQYCNITIVNRFLTQSEIAQIHAEYGIFLCPTRQDSQGVSMCEAMSSGLVPITSNKTAIPEFVKNGSTGFLTNNYEEIAETIEYLYFNPNKFLQISVQASESIKQISGEEYVIKKELEIIQDKSKI